MENGWRLKEGVYDPRLGLGRVVDGVWRGFWSLRRGSGMIFVLYKNENFAVGNGP